MNKITQLFSLFLTLFLFVACAETPTKDNQPKFIPKNFLDRTLQHWPALSTEDSLRAAKTNAILEIKRKSYKGEIHSIVVTNLSEMGILCIKGKNEFSYVNCDYCKLKEEIVPENYSLFNRYIVAGVYWNIRLILAASPSDIGDASIDQISVRLSIASD